MDSSFRKSFRQWIGRTPSPTAWVAVGLALVSASGCATSPKMEAKAQTSFEPGVKPENDPEAEAVAQAEVDAPPSPPSPPESFSTPAVAPAQMAQLDPPPGAAPALKPQEPPPESALQARIALLEDRIAALSEKLERQALPAPERIAAVPHPADTLGDIPEETPSARDPQAGFTNDAPVRSFRQAMILFRSTKYSEAILAFSAFLQNYAEHPLAGSAQFYVGESYFRQKEYRLAAQEYERVLSAYDRSPHVSTALQQLAAAQDALQMADEAAKNRQQLASLFPLSPAAESLFNALAAQAPAETANTVATAPEPAAGAAEKIDPLDTVQGERSQTGAPETAPLPPSEPTTP